MKPISDFRSRCSRFLRLAGVLCALASAGAGGNALLRAASFGKVIPIGGNASDLALDEARGVLYIANFTANRIEVLNLSDHAISRSFNVPAQPGSLALSPDGRFLVVTHFGNVDTTTGATPYNGLTVLNLANGQQQRYTLGFPPLGVAFGADGQALLATTVEILLFDPASGAVRVLETIAEIAARAIPVEQDGRNFPPNIVASSLAATPDGRWIVGTLGAGPDGDSRLDFVYSVVTRQLSAAPGGSTPPMGPRVVSVARDGSYFMSGWTLRSAADFSLISQVANVSGLFQYGSHVIDSERGVIYGQFPPSAQGGGGGDTLTPENPVLFVLDAANLAVLDRLQLPENLAGKAMLDRAATTLYAISDSGVLVGRVGDFTGVRRLRASKEDLVFRGNFCDRKVITQEFTLTDAAGGAIDFTLSTDVPGLTLSPASGVTPAVIRVQVNPTVYANRQGTTSGAIQVRSRGAVNLPDPIRVLVNARDPDQRGTFVNVPGRLVDILADPLRNRFYVLRQDRNQLLVFDGSNFSQIAVLKTYNTPTQMAITADGRHLLVGHDNSAWALVVDLEPLRATAPVIFPRGHYPRSIAASGRAILAAMRVAGETHVIDAVDLAARRGATLPRLGVFKNDIHINTTLVAPPNGSSILGVMADGRVLLYEASADTFTVLRKDYSELAGTYAASNHGAFLVGNRLLNASLVQQRQIEPALGFSFIDDTAVRIAAAGPASPGTISRLDLATGQSVRPTRTVEAPVTEAVTPGFAFIRTLAALSNRQAFVALTQSGFTVYPWSYDAATPIPSLDRVVNAADQTAPVAPGGLISVLGQDLSPINIATREIPLPTALGESCLTVNGAILPLVFVSANQINAQLPFHVDGKAQLVLRTPAGVSNNLNFTIQPTAPSVFRSAGDGTPIVVRDGELVGEENPIRPGDHLVIYATGLGLTSPAVEAGLPGPDGPLAETVVAPEVDLAGDPLEVAYAGLAPGQVGVYQLNVKVGGAVRASGVQELRIRQGESETRLPVPVHQ